MYKKLRFIEKNPQQSNKREKKTFLRSSTRSLLNMSHKSLSPGESLGPLNTKNIYKLHKQ